MTLEMFLVSSSYRDVCLIPVSVTIPYTAAQSVLKKTQTSFNTLHLTAE